MSDSILQVNQIKDKGGNATGITVADTTANVTINNLAGGAIGSAVTMSANQACVKTALNASGDAPIYACRAWVNFTGSSNSTQTINGSSNVTSVTRNAAGDYSINFTTAMPDANYCISVSCADGNTNNNVVVSAINGTNAQTASVARVFTMSEDSGATDPVLVHIAIFR